MNSTKFNYTEILLYFKEHRIQIFMTDQVHVVSDYQTMRNVMNPPSCKLRRSVGGGGEDDEE